MYVISLKVHCLALSLPNYNKFQFKNLYLKLKVAFYSFLLLNIIVFDVQGFKVEELSRLFMERSRKKVKKKKQITKTYLFLIFQLF